jgi:deoxycytidylate deaminase
MQNDSNKIIYPYIPSGRSILLVSADNSYIQRAMVCAKSTSTDQNHPTGAVVVKDGEIIGEASNQSGYKYKFLIDAHKTWFCIRRLFKVKSGTNYWLCPGCATSKNHAETRACIDAIKNNGKENVKGSDLYLWGHWWCCKSCWDTMIESGINNVYLQEGSEIIFK